MIPGLGQDRYKTGTLCDVWHQKNEVLQNLWGNFHDTGVLFMLFLLEEEIKS
jgi:hypothetical protein